MTSRDARNGQHHGILRIFRRSVNELGSSTTASCNTPHKIRITDIPCNVQKTELFEINSMDFPSNKTNPKHVFQDKKNCRWPLKQTVTDRPALSNTNRREATGVSTFNDGDKVKSLHISAPGTLKCNANNHRVPNSLDPSNAVEDWSIDLLDVRVPQQSKLSEQVSLIVGSEIHNKPEGNICENEKSMTKTSECKERNILEFNKEQDMNAGHGKYVEDWTDQLIGIPYEHALTNCDAENADTFGNGNNLINELVYFELDKSDHSTPKKLASGAVSKSQCIEKPLFCMSLPVPNMESKSDLNTALRTHTEINMSTTSNDVDARCWQKTGANICMCKNCASCRHGLNNSIPTKADPCTNDHDSNSGEPVADQALKASPLEKIDDSIISIGKIPKLNCSHELKHEDIPHLNNTGNSQQCLKPHSVHVPWQIEDDHVFNVDSRLYQKLITSSNSETETLVSLEILEYDAETERKAAADIWNENDERQKVSGLGRVSESHRSDWAKLMDSNVSSTTEPIISSEVGSSDSELTRSPSRNERLGLHSRCRFINSVDDDIPPRFRKATQPKNMKPVLSYSPGNQSRTYVRSHPKHSGRNTNYECRQPHKITQSPRRGNTDQSWDSTSRKSRERQESSSNAFEYIPVKSVLCKGGFSKFKQCYSDNEVHLKCNEKCESATPNKNIPVVTSAVYSRKHPITPLLDRKITTPEKFKNQSYNCHNNFKTDKKQDDIITVRTRMPVSEDWTGELQEIADGTEHVESTEIESFHELSGSKKICTTEDNTIWSESVVPDTCKSGFKLEVSTMHAFPMSENKIKTASQTSQSFTPYLPPTPEEDVEPVYGFMQANDESDRVNQIVTCDASACEEVNLKTIAKPPTIVHDREFEESTGFDQPYLPPAPDEVSFAPSPLESDILAGNTAIGAHHNLEKVSIEENYDSKITEMDNTCTTKRGHLQLNSSSDYNRPVLLQNFSEEMECLNDKIIAETNEEMNLISVVKNECTQTNIDKGDSNVAVHRINSRAIHNEHNERKACVKIIDGEETLITTNMNINLPANENVTESQECKNVSSNGPNPTDVNAHKITAQVSLEQENLITGKINTSQNVHNDKPDNSKMPEYYMDDEFQRYLQNYQHWYIQQAREISQKHGDDAFPWYMSDDYENRYMKHCFDYSQLDYDNAGIIPDAESNVSENKSAFWAERLPYWVQCQASENESKQKHQSENQTVCYPSSSVNSKRPANKQANMASEGQHNHSKKEYTNKASKSKSKISTFTELTETSVQQRQKHVSENIPSESSPDDFVVDICDSNIEEVDIYVVQPEITTALGPSRKTCIKNEHRAETDVPVMDEIVTNACHGSAEEVVSEDCRVRSNIGQTCTCDKEAVRYYVWRTCQCEGGLWPRIQDVVPVCNDDRSMDLGYQSYDSIDESTSIRLKSLSSSLSLDRQPGRKINIACDLNSHVSNLKTHKKADIEVHTSTDKRENAETCVQHLPGKCEKVVIEKYSDDSHRNSALSKRYPQLFVSRAPQGFSPQVYMVNENNDSVGRRFDRQSDDQEKHEPQMNVEANCVPMDSARKQNCSEQNNGGTNKETGEEHCNLRQIVNKLQHKNVLMNRIVSENTDKNANFTKMSSDKNISSREQSVPMLNTSMDTIAEESRIKTEVSKASHRNDVSQQPLDVNSNVTLGHSTIPRQMVENLHAINKSELPECCKKSANHLAKADSGLCKAEATREILSNALKTISNAIFDYGKRLEVSRELDTIDEGTIEKTVVTTASWKKAHENIDHKVSGPQDTVNIDANNNNGELQNEATEFQTDVEYKDLANLTEDFADLKDNLMAKETLKSLMKPVPEYAKVRACEIVASSTDTDVCSETSDSFIGMPLSQSPDNSDDQAIQDHEVLSSNESSDYLHFESKAKPNHLSHQGYCCSLPTGFSPDEPGKFRYGMESRFPFGPQFSMRSPLITPTFPYGVALAQADGNGTTIGMPQKSDNESISSPNAGVPLPSSNVPRMPMHPPLWPIGVYPPWYSRPPGTHPRQPYMERPPIDATDSSGCETRKPMPISDVQLQSPYLPWLTVPPPPPPSSSVIDKSTLGTAPHVSTGSKSQCPADYAESVKKPVKLVEYGSSDVESDSEEVEPFDISTLNSKGEKPLETKPQVTASYNDFMIQHTPKRLKCSSSENESSEDCFKGSARKQISFTVRGAKTLSRKMPKKLNQKSLKSFTSQEWKPHTTVHETSHSATTQSSAAARTFSSVVAAKASNKPVGRKKTIAEVLAASKKDSATSGTEADCDTDVEVRGHSQEFPPLYQKKDLPPFPPLPPFPASPFWGMYLPNSSSALTGKRSKEPLQTPAEKAENVTSETKKNLQSPVGRYTRRSWSPACSMYSPGGLGSLLSPSDASSDGPSTTSDWKAQFRQFHSFGVKYIDTHCHLDFLFSRENFRGNFRAYREANPETFPDTFEGCVAVFCNPATFNPDYGLWRHVAEEVNVWFAMGCHPKMAQDFTTAAEKGLKKCLQHQKCVALGEIGLDYSGTFWKYEEVQKKVFRRQLEIAIQTGKPLVIHCRDAEDDCLAIMKEMVPPKYKIHCHCFTGSWYNAQKWIEPFPNLYIGLTPVVTYRTATPSHDLAKNIPLNKLLLETDAPYFIPRTIPKDEMPYSNPGLAVTVAKEVAQYQELPVAAVLRQCRVNTKYMYGI